MRTTFAAVTAAMPPRPDELVGDEDEEYDEYEEEYEEEYEDEIEEHELAAGT